MEKIIRPCVVGISILVGIAFSWNVVLAQPTETWVAPYNGPSNLRDLVRALAVDTVGNVYVTGWSVGSGTGADYLTIKYDGATGQQLWVARYNGPNNGDDGAYALVVDGADNVYVTGSSRSSGSDVDYLTIKYDGATGRELWASLYDGPGNGHDVATALAVDSGGNVYVTGKSTGSGSSIDYATIKYDGDTGAALWIDHRPAGLQWATLETYLAIDNAGDVVMAGTDRTNDDYGGITRKFSAEGVIIWEVIYDGGFRNSSLINGLGVDSRGNVYVTGHSRKSGNNDYVTIKYDGDTRRELWIARHNGSAKWDDRAQALVVDGADNVYVTGVADFVCGMYAGCFGAYATIKYDGGTGQELWLAPYDGTVNLDWGTALAVDGSDNVYVTGLSNADYVTIKYHRATGRQLWLARYNGPDNGFDRPHALAVDSGGNVYVTGYVTRADYSLDYATIKYAPTRSAVVLGTALRLDDWTNPLFVCFDRLSRESGWEGLPIASAGPSCPPPPDCTSCSLAAGWDPGKTPSYLPEIYLEILGASGPGPQWYFAEDALSRLMTLLKKATANRPYAKSLTATILKTLNESNSAQAVSPEVVGKVLEVANAIELDWRVPRVASQEVKPGEYSAVGFQGIAWVAMRDVVKPGKVELQVENGLPATALGFRPGWPIATYTFEFTGHLGKDGYVDVSIHIGGRRFTGSLSELRVLEWDGKLYKDITTHVDARRGVITGRTNRLSTYVLMTPVVRRTGNK